MLSDFFTAVQVKLVERLAGAELDGTVLWLPEAVPIFHVGGDKVANEDSPPRIVFIPGVETWRGPHHQGGDGVRNPRALRTRHARVSVHIWGADEALEGNDLEATERLLNHFVAAAYDVGWGVVEFISGDWLAKESATKKGMVYVLEMEVQIPATRELDVYATVNTIPITPVVVPQVPTG